MNMSFGVSAAPPPPSGEGGGGDLPPSSSAPSTAVPLVPPSFSLSSASFTFQGSSANPMPPPRPSFAPSSGFSFPGAQANPPPSSGPPSLTPPPLFPLSGAAPRFSYPGPPPNTSSIAPPSTSAVPPFSMPSGFSYQGPSGNPPPLSAVASGSHSFAISNSLMGFSGHSPGIHVRPPPAQMAIIGMPSTATSQAPQGSVSGVQLATQPTQAQSIHGAGPSPPLQVSGTPPGQSSTSSSPQPLTLQGSPATSSHPALQGSTTAAVPSAITPGTASISVSSEIGISVETEEAHGHMSHQSTPGGFPPHPVPILPATQMRPSMPGTIPPPGMTVSPQVVSGATQPLQGQGTAGAVLPASAPPTTVVPPPAMPPVQVFPGQMPVTTVSPPVGAVPVRPGPMPPTSTTLPFVPPRPVYSTNLVAAPPLVPPGVLGSAPAGMAPRFPAPPFAPMVRTPNFPPRTASPLVRPPPGTMLRPGTLVPKFQMGPAGADLSKAVGTLLLLEKPQTLVYVGKIATTVDDDFLRSILELCGPIKSWKRAQEPTVGTPKGFGFCEFESAEGVLRALRLLNGFSLEGQELKITVNPTTREYLERFVQKKKEREQQLKLEASQAIEMEVETAPGVEAPEPVKKPVVEAQNNDPSIENQGSDAKRFGLVNDEDKGADDEAQKKLTSLLEERARLMPLPPPPPLPSASDAPCKSNSMSDTPAKSRDGDSVADGGKTVGQEGTNEEETSENKASSELDRPETSSSDRGRRLDHYRDRERDRGRERDRDKGRDRESRDRDRDRDRDRERERERELKREKEWELEQMERDRERSRARRERERELRMRDAERVYEDREKVWEEREKEKERIRNVDREKEKEREKLRWRLIKDQEEESDDEGWKKWRRRGDPYGERKRIQRERDDDEKDRVKEEEEVVEAKRRKLKEDYEEQVKKRLAEMAQMEAAEAAAKALDGSEGGTLEPEATKNAGAMVSESKERNHVQLANGGDDEFSTKSACDMVIDEEVENSLVSMEIDEKRNNSPAPKKLGFGLVGSGKRTAVPSVFHQEDEQEAPKDRGLRQLVPIDYTVEEMQAVSSLKANVTLGSAASNLAAAAEFAKSLSNLGNSSSKEDLESERDRARRHSEKSKDKNQWVEDRGKDRERGSRDEMDRFRERDKDKHRYSDGNREKDHTSAKLDTKQLIDSIPKTKEELFAYIIDWKIYDQHELHERMRPWIQKKITEFLGEEEDTLVDFIVSNTRKHTGAANMLELLTTILDDEAEMFVMKMWRMLIFEIKKVETGLSTKPKA